LIEEKHVVTMKIPFPSISSGLAVSPHMYVCLTKQQYNKKFIKCQSLKPHHLGRNKRPYYRIVENVDINRNPFNRTTLIDCDKQFQVDGVEICTSLLTKKRNDVCDELFMDIRSMINNDVFETNLLNREELKELNYKIKLVRQA